VLPGAESPITSCGGANPGNAVTVDVTNQPFGSSSFVLTITDNGTPVGGSPITVSAPNKRDKTAECVVQLPPGDVGPTPAHYTELADFGTAFFSKCQATATQNAGDSLDVDQLASGSDGAFTVTSLDMGRPNQSKAITEAPNFPNPAWSVSWESIASTKRANS
jgi:Peptidase A4 family